MKIRPSCSMRTYGRTDMTKLIVAFGNFANAPEKVLISVCQSLPMLVHWSPIFLVQQM